MRIRAHRYRALSAAILATATILLSDSTVQASDHGSAHGSGDSHASADAHGAPAAPAAHGSHGAAEPQIDIDAAAAEIGAEVRGIELGFFKVRSDYPVQAQKSMVRFVLQTGVPTERYAELKALIEHNLHRLRDQIITVTRLAPLTVFDEPELTTFRRLIVVRLRRTLPELEIDDVYISDFQLSVKSL